MIGMCIGWIGTIILLATYYLFSIGRIKGDTVGYHTFWFLGNIFLSIGYFIGGAYFGVCVGVVFAIIALNAIRKIRKDKKESQRVDKTS